MKNYTISRKGTNVSLTINEQFTIESVSAIKQQIMQHAEKATNITVHLKAIETIDIAAAQLLVAFQIMVKKNGGSIRFISEKSQSVLTFLQNTGLNRYITAS